MSLVYAPDRQRTIETIGALALTALAILSQTLESGLKYVHKRSQPITLQALFIHKQAQASVDRCII